MSTQVPAIKVLLLPKDTNALGTIFGGVILSHIDLAPFPSETTRVGRTSITVKVVVEAERWGAGQGERVRVTEAEVVLVAIGPDGVPVPVRPE